MKAIIFASIFAAMGLSTMNPLFAAKAPSKAGRSVVQEEELTGFEDALFGYAESESPRPVIIENQISLAVGDAKSNNRPNPFSRKNTKGKTMLHIAAERGNSTFLKALKNKAQDAVKDEGKHDGKNDQRDEARPRILEAMNEVDNDGNTPLMLAAKAQKNKAECVAIIMQIGAADMPKLLKTKNSDGKNFFHIVAEQNDDSLTLAVFGEKPTSMSVPFLLIDVNLLNDRDDEGNTPAHLAIQHENFEFMKCIMRSTGVRVKDNKLKTDFDIKNKDGRNLLQEAEYQLSLDSENKGKKNIWDLIGTLKNTKEGMSGLVQGKDEIGSLDAELEEYKKQRENTAGWRFISRGILKTKIKELETQLDEKKAEQSQLDMEQRERVAHGNMLMESSKK